MKETEKEDWPDAKKWRMDLLKSAIAFGAAALISLFVIEHLQYVRAVAKAKEDAFYNVRLKALDDFRRSAVAYDLAAHSAYTDLYQWKDKIKTASMIRYEQEAYPTWRLAYETVLHLFPKNKAAMDDYLKKNTERHKLYDNLVDRRLDGTGLTPIDPWTYRNNFDKFTQEMGAIRSQLVQQIQKELFPSEE